MIAMITATIAARAATHAVFFALRAILVCSKIEASLRASSFIRSRIAASVGSNWSVMFDDKPLAHKRLTVFFELCE